MLYVKIMSSNRHKGTENLLIKQGFEMFFYDSRKIGRRNR